MHGCFTYTPFKHTVVCVMTIDQDSTEGATTAGALGGMVYKGSYFIVFFLGVAAFILGH